MQYERVLGFRYFITSTFNSIILLQVNYITCLKIIFKFYVIGIYKTYVIQDLQ